jgi:hypothetical protein
MYQKQFWMFCVLLIIITLLSSIGGGIRFRENFLEEVFDLNDITEDLESNIYYPLVYDNHVSEETERVMPVVTAPSVAPKKIEEETVENVPVQLKQPSASPTYLSPFEVIEAYSGEAFASF